MHFDADEDSEHNVTLKLKTRKSEPQVCLSVCLSPIPTKQFCSNYFFFKSITTKKISLWSR